MNGLCGPGVVPDYEIFVLDAETAYLRRRSDVVLEIIDSHKHDPVSVVLFRYWNAVSDISVGRHRFAFCISEIYVVQNKSVAYLLLRKGLLALIVYIPGSYLLHYKTGSFFKNTLIRMDFDACRRISSVQCRRLYGRFYFLYASVVDSKLGPIKLHVHRLRSKLRRDAFHNRHKHLQRNIFAICLFYQLELHHFRIEIVRVVVLINNIVSFRILLRSKHRRIDKGSLRRSVFPYGISLIKILEILQISELIVHRHSYKLGSQIVFAILYFKPDVMIYRIVGHRINGGICCFVHVCLERVLSVGKLIGIRFYRRFFHQPSHSVCKFTVVERYFQDRYHGELAAVRIVFILAIDPQL